MDDRIQHWLLSVARAAGLAGSDTLAVAADTAPAAAWETVAMSAGISQDELARVVAGHFGLEVTELEAMDPQAHKLVPGSLARRLGVIPLDYSDRHLSVATADPVSLEIEKALKRISDRNIAYRIASPAAIRPAVERVYDGEEDGHQLPDLGPEALGVPRILVVEDDPDTRLLLRSALETIGYEVVEAADGESALELLEETGGFSLISMDLKLPGLSGLEVLERIRRKPRWKGLPVVVATGYDDPEVEVLLFQSGADDYIVKPVDPRRFLLRVQAVLRRRGVVGAEAPPSGGEASEGEASGEG